MDLIQMIPKPKLKFFQDTPQNLMRHLAPGQFVLESLFYFSKLRDMGNLLSVVIVCFMAKVDM